MFAKKNLSAQQKNLAKVGIISIIDEAVEQANAAKPLKIRTDFKSAMKRVTKAKPRKMN